MNSLQEQHYKEDIAYAFKWLLANNVRKLHNLLGRQLDMETLDLSCVPKTIKEKFKHLTEVFGDLLTSAIQPNPRFDSSRLSLMGAFYNEDICGLAFPELEHPSISKCRLAYLPHFLTMVKKYIKDLAEYLEWDMLQTTPGSMYGRFMEEFDFFIYMLEAQVKGMGQVLYELAPAFVEHPVDYGVRQTDIAMSIASKPDSGYVSDSVETVIDDSDSDSDLPLDSDLDLTVKKKGKNIFGIPVIIRPRSSKSKFNLEVAANTRRMLSFEAANTKKAEVSGQPKKRKSLRIQVRNIKPRYP